MRVFADYAQKSSNKLLDTTTTTTINKYEVKKNTAKIQKQKRLLLNLVNNYNNTGRHIVLYIFLMYIEKFEK